MLQAAWWVAEGKATTWHWITSPQNHIECLKNERTPTFLSLFLLGFCHTGWHCLPSHNLHTSLASLKTSAWFYLGVFVVYKKGKALYHVDFLVTMQKRCSAPGIQLEFIIFIYLNVALRVLFITFLCASVKLFTLFWKVLYKYIFLNYYYYSVLTACIHFAYFCPRNIMNMFLPHSIIIIFHLFHFIRCIGNSWAQQKVRINTGQEQVLCSLLILDNKWRLCLIKPLGEFTPTSHYVRDIL